MFDKLKGSVFSHGIACATVKEVYSNQCCISVVNLYLCALEL